VDIDFNLEEYLTIPARLNRVTIQSAILVGKEDFVAKANELVASITALNQANFDTRLMEPEKAAELLAYLRDVSHRVAVQSNAVRRELDNLKFNIEFLSRKCAADLVKFER
jgi:hypothetical protein